ncbi:MAG TPA: ATP-binding cassette domain-containing protein [Anaerolineae bacterium]|nr:ATP-binding cassette domain-containing protein [Anaerolineae bacterium]
MIDRGQVIVEPGVTLGYYAQQLVTLDRSQPLIDVIRQAKQFGEPEAATLLIEILFSDERCCQRVNELSSGERCRLQLAPLMISTANFLLLDEPRHTTSKSLQPNCWKKS